MCVVQLLNKQENLCVQAYKSSGFSFQF